MQRRVLYATIALLPDLVQTSATSDACSMELQCLHQLDRSHRRHDDVVAALVAAARRAAAGRAEPEVLQPVHDALAYFSRAAPRHFLDEDGSVFPRLSMRQPSLAPTPVAASAIR